MKSDKKGTSLFRKTSLVTLVAVYFLILVGGIVRSTGAGMGCPDWPKCFGTWIPPTSEAQLSDTYKHDFVEYRKNKNQKFAAYLDILGFKEKAAQVRNDQSILDESVFNVTKTWTEYVNRLIGSLVGLLIILNFIASIKYFKQDKIIFILSLLLVFLVIFQGWIGSVVVSTNLIPWMVTVHMLLALLIVAILIYLVYRARSESLTVASLPKKGLLNALLILSGLLIITQITFGTQVREAIDDVAYSLQYMNRDAWVGLAGTSFIIHRSFSIILLLSQLAIVFIIYRNSLSQIALPFLSGLVLALMILEAASGIIMAYFGIPPSAQPMHLLIALVIFGLQFLMILMLNKTASDVIFKPEIV
jgi:cytochrome c oxidase assembly protein subunit 15